VHKAVERAEAMATARQTRKLGEPAWDALTEALATYYWYKSDLKAFLYRQLREHHEILARLDFDLSKRQIAGSLVGLLAGEEARYQVVAIDLLVALHKFDPTFPRLAALDDGAAKVRQAKAAHAAVVQVTDQYSELAEQRERLQAELGERKATDATRRSHDAKLGELRDAFLAMRTMTDRHERGHRLEQFLNSLFALHDLEPRAAYSLEHEQIDGAFTFDTDDYLLEARWWSTAMQPADVHPFKAKVESKAKHTFGLFISVNGFTAGAIELYSRATSIIFMDGGDLVPVLEDRVNLTEVLLRKRRHAAETGNPMLPVAQMLG
jgi:Restriction endonuclease